MVCVSPWRIDAGPVRGGSRGAPDEPSRGAEHGRSRRRTNSRAAPAQDPCRGAERFRDLLNLIRDRKPDYLAAAFDGGGKVFRSELSADYKAQRAAMPEDLVPQIPVIRKVFEGFRVPILIHAGMEADDVIATLARR